MLKLFSVSCLLLAPGHPSCNKFINKSFSFWKLHIFWRSVHNIQKAQKVLTVLVCVIRVGDYSKMERKFNLSYFMIIFYSPAAGNALYQILSDNLLCDSLILTWKCTLEGSPVCCRGLGRWWVLVSADTWWAEHPCHPARHTESCAATTLYPHRKHCMQSSPQIASWALWSQM